MPKPSSADDVKLMSSYETVRATCFSTPSSPIASTSRSPFGPCPTTAGCRPPFSVARLRDLLAHAVSNSWRPPPASAARSWMTFVKLLVRATKDDSTGPDTLNELPGRRGRPDHRHRRRRASSIRPASRKSSGPSGARRPASHGVGQELLGRLAPSLQRCPPSSGRRRSASISTRRWATSASSRRTAKSGCNVVLEVFHTVHQMLSHIDPDGDLAVRLAPRNIAAVEDWMAEAKSRSFPPGLGRDRAVPGRAARCKQLEIDAGDTVAKLARGRLGVGAKAESVRNQSKSLGVTRARVYQLLEECNNVMSVRWPDGRRLLDDFAQWLDENYASADVRQPARQPPRAALSAQVRLRRRAPAGGIARVVTVKASGGVSPPVSSDSCEGNLTGRLTPPARLQDRRAPDSTTQTAPRPAPRIRASAVRRSTFVRGPAGSSPRRRQ